MIKTRLIDLVPESKKDIVLNVFAQWIGMCALGVVWVCHLIYFLGFVKTKEESHGIDE